MNDTRPHVLVTRPREAADRFAGEIAALGYTPVICPLIELTPTHHPLPTGPFSALIVTSQSAVRFLPVTPALERTPLYAVGHVTSEACRKAGFANVTCAGETVDNMLQTLTKEATNLRTGSVLYASGTRISHDLPTLLKPAGIEVLRVPVYASDDLSLSEEAIHLLCKGQIMWITLFSRHTAAVLAREIARLENQAWTSEVGLACLAPGMAQIVAPFRWREVGTALQPTEVALLACLAKGLADGGYGHAHE